MTSRYLSIDLGAESGRVMLGTLEDGRIALEELILLMGQPRWEVEALLEELEKKELVLVPELNYQGQMAMVLRSMGINAEAMTQYTGLPFNARALSERIKARVATPAKTSAVKA